MSTLKVNKIQPFSGNDISFEGNFVPSSSKGDPQSLGSLTSPWAELYVSTGSVNFMAPGTPAVTVARLRAGGQAFASAGPIQGMIFTETNGNLRGSFSVGRDNQASGTASLANGLANTASGFYSHAEGNLTQATGYAAHAEGYSNRAIGVASHAEGNTTLASGLSSHTEGQLTTASGDYSHAEGYLSRATGYGAHAEGNASLSSGGQSHAEGTYTTASGNSSHAEGASTLASGLSSHAEGLQTIASGDYSHAEGAQTIASGYASHAGGNYSTASGVYTFAHGEGLQALNQAKTVVGQYNVLGDSSSLFVVGAGINNGNRKNGFSVELADGTLASVVIPSNTTNPTNPKAGAMYFNSGNGFLYMYNGTAWRSSSFS